jgi:hypothetical protein
LAVAVAAPVRAVSLGPPTSGAPEALQARAAERAVLREQAAKRAALRRERRARRRLEPVAQRVEPELVAQRAEPELVAPRA